MDTGILVPKLQLGNQSLVCKGFKISNRYAQENITPTKRLDLGRPKRLD